VRYIVNVVINFVSVNRLYNKNSNTIWIIQLSTKSVKSNRKNLRQIFFVYQFPEKLQKIGQNYGRNYLFIYMRRLTTGIHFKICVVRRFRLCANIKASSKLVLTQTQIV
jgi:hypothetical protein